MVDTAVEKVAARWTRSGPSALMPAPLWNAGDGCGRPEPTLTSGIARLSTIHRHPYDDDLSDSCVVGECTLPHGAPGPHNDCSPQ